MSSSSEHGMGPIVIHKIRNLVFQGGSVKGVSYGGAVGALHKAFTLKGLDFHKQIQNVAGTSAGAITALGMAVGANVEDLVMTIGNTDFKTFLDTKAYEIVSNISSESSSGPSKSSSALATLPLLTSSMGLASGQEVLDFLESYATERTGISHLTFAELHELVLQERNAPRDKCAKKKEKGSYKDLFVVAYNLTVDDVFVFNYLKTPDTIISDAVRCSMSIPFVFVPHKNYIKKPNPDKPGEYTRVEGSEDLWIDGGITDNYPIGVFDKLKNVNYEDTLGFYLASREEKADIEGHPLPASERTQTHREIKNILDYAKCVIETVISSQQTSAHKQSDDINRTIYIDHMNMSMMNFGMTLEDKNALISSGWNSVCERLRLVNEIGKCEVLLKPPVEEVKEEDGPGHGDKCSIA